MFISLNVKRELITRVIQIIWKSDLNCIIMVKEQNIPEAEDLLNWYGIKNTSISKRHFQRK